MVFSSRVRCLGFELPEQLAPISLAPRSARKLLRIYVELQNVSIATIIPRETYSMTRRSKQRQVTGAELKAAFDDWKRKERCFTALASGMRKHPESSIDLAARASEEAFNFAYKMLLRATGSRNNQACVAILPDGSHMVAVRQKRQFTSDERVTLELVPASRVVSLS
jgi:hypothetical protein